MKELIDLLHILSCEHPHETDMMKVIERPDSTRCYFYLEDSVSGGAQLPDHIKWTDIAEKFKITMSLKNDTDALNFLRDCLKVSHQLQSLIQGDQFRLAFMKKLLNI